MSEKELQIIRVEKNKPNLVWKFGGIRNEMNELMENKIMEYW